MVLDRENRQFFMPDSLYRVVVQVQMGDLQAGRQCCQVDCVTVILRGYISAPGDQVFNRMISAPMAEFQFLGLAAEGVRDELVP